MRSLLDAATVAADLDCLAAEQADDGGWSVDFQSYSPAAALEWRGYATVLGKLPPGRPALLFGGLVSAAHSAPPPPGRGG